MSATNTNTNATNPVLGFSNILSSPGSTWAGAAAILGVIANAMGTNGFPTSAQGWLGFGGSLVLGLGAIFSRA